MEEDKDVENIVGDADGPSPDIFFYQEPDTRCSSDEAENLNPVAGDEAEDFGPNAMHSALRLLRFARLIHIANRRLVDQRMGRAAVQLDARPVIPLDAPLHFFPAL